MRIAHYISFLALAAIISALLCGCAHDIKPGAVFLPVEVKEHSVGVNIAGYPDEVALFFFAENFSLGNATLTEVVGERVDAMQFAARRVLPESLEALIFVEDCSGSMKEHIPRADKMIAGSCGAFRGIEIGLIRVGKNAIWAQSPIAADKFAALDMQSLPYPRPNGTSLAEALRIALDEIGDRQGVIVLIADGSQVAEPRLSRAVHNAAARRIPVITFQMDGASSKTLRDIALETGGVFTPDDKNTLEEILSYGWWVNYSPAVNDTDGAEHQIVLRWGSHRRMASYIAPGTPKAPRAPEPEPQILPVELIAGVRIPFMRPDNVELIATTQRALDSLVWLIKSADIPTGSVLRIEGYTCNLGTREYNSGLSLRRAKAVANYVRQNCDVPLQYEIVGNGESNPLLPNTCEPNRRANRRAEVRLLAAQFQTKREAK